MRRISLFAGVVAVAFSVSAGAAPGNNSRSVSLPAQPLGASLQAIAQRYGVELLFSQAVIGDRSAPPIAGRMGAEQALNLALAGSGLAAKKTGDGGFVITTVPVSVSEQPEAIPEILVVGRRTQNTDVRRTENDVRPYQVVSRQDIATSHVSTVEELAGKRFPANNLAATLSQQGAISEGSTASSINFRGLGTSQTLILVDGRHLPLMPGTNAGFNQTDVNAIPPEAVERVEAINATAGGIYGPGATAGVVNLVLQRDYRGVDVSVTNGITSRGDAPYRRANLRFGFTPDDGATDVMVNLGASDFGGLDMADRDYLIRSNNRIFSNQPDYYVRAGPPSSASLTVVADNGQPLKLKPTYGGGQLATPTTFAAAADGRSMTDLVQTLVSNDGKIDLTLGPDSEGDSQTLLSGRRTTSIITSIRHRSGPVDFFLDYIRLDNQGHAQTAYLASPVSLRANDPNNPFSQAVLVYAPDPVETVKFDFENRVVNLTAGLIVDLPASWRAEGDYSTGSGISSYQSRGRQLTLAGTRAYGRGRIANPLLGYQGYLKSFDGLFRDYRQDVYQRNRFDNASIRLAGPVLPLPGGDITTTLLAEQRRDQVRNATQYTDSRFTDGGETEGLPSYSQRIRSLYGEIRAPIIGSASGFRPLRGLEFQLALRHDWGRTGAAQDLFSIDGPSHRTVRQAGLVYTAGFKFSPVEGAVLRGSISTGRQPLNASDLSRRRQSGVDSILIDPKRPGAAPQPIDEVFGGPPHPRPERAASLSAGIIIQPAASPDLRLSVDYTHIDKRGESVVTMVNGVDYFVANEDQYADRVVRMPLTAADAALGYTGGVITQVDTSSLQNGRTVIDTIDGLVDYSMTLQDIGVLAFHAATAWQPKFRRIVGFGLPSRNYVGATDGAPAFKANFGLRLSSESLTLSADTQLIGRYRITSPLEYRRDIDESSYVIQQGGSSIPAQATLDLAVEYRLSLKGQGFAGRPRSLSIRLGAQNIMDTRPVTVVNSIAGYNNYIDPRRRRFDLTVAAGF